MLSGARPTYIKPGPVEAGQDEVQQITIVPVVTKFAGTGASFTMTAGGKPVKTPGGEEEFDTEAFAGNPENEASAANVQAALEGEEFFGKGNVEVTGGPEVPQGPVTGKPLIITSKKPGAAPKIEVTVVVATEVKAEIVTPGRPPGSNGEIVLRVENLGDAPAVGAKSPVVISDVLPKGLEAVGIGGGKNNPGNGFAPFQTPCKLATLTCEWSSEVKPYEELEMRVAVVVKPGTPECEPGSITCERNDASVSGGETPAASASEPVAVSGLAVPFGLEDYELKNEEPGGVPATQAGAHPFQQTNVVSLNQGADTAPLSGKTQVFPVGLARDFNFIWPAGLIGDPSAIPECSAKQFVTQAEGFEGDECPSGSAVGIAAIEANAEPDGFFADTVPLFNLEPNKGEPARFGFYLPSVGAEVYIDAAVRTGQDYGVTVSSSNITQTASFLSAHVTVWGVPGDPRHNASRGWACLDSLTAVCEQSQPSTAPAFLSMPTSCQKNPLTGAPEELASTAYGKSWSETGALKKLAEYKLPSLSGCDELPFEPSIRATPDGTAASSPTGLTVDVHVPQEESLNATGLAVAAPRSITVALPPGVAVNPSSGGGLQSCTSDPGVSPMTPGNEIGYEGFRELTPGFSPATFSPFLPESIAALESGDHSPLQPGVNFCPDAAKIATVTIKTPILPQPLEGAVYLATQNQNPFGSLLAMYIVAEDKQAGVLVKLPGEVQLCKQASEVLAGMTCAAPGQLVTTFLNSPQTPFEDAELHFFGGERAPLATPARCGSYETQAAFVPWSAQPATALAGGDEAALTVRSSSTFNISSGPHGTPCPGASLPFSPSLTGGTTNINAGGFSPLTTTISRQDGEQDLQQVVLHMPAGLEGLLSNVKLCPEAQANEGTCGPESLIGETTVSAGVGADPVSVKGGRVYITEKYAGAPFGLSIVNPVKAGPFDLEHDTANPANQPPCDCVVVRAKIEVNPVTAELTVTTDSSGPHAIPHLIDGIPVQIKAVNVLVNREKFTFNPTNCSPQSMTGLISSDEGAGSPVSVPFQPTNCAVLKYAPTLSVSTAAKASKSNGASLFFKIAYPKAAMGSQSWMKYMKFDIPKQLPARLTTIQKACLAATFEHNRAACPAASVIGHLVVHTEVLPVPLEGPLYFVSYGGAAFPDAVAVLHGYGLTIESHGHTFINGKTGVTSATFETVPDVPFESIEVTVPQGPFSEFGANLPAKANDNFCGQKLVMPIRFKAQNGLEITQNTPVGVTGCPRALTKKQKLAAALKACHKKHGKKRASCEKAARKQYGHIAKSKKGGK